MISKDYFSSLSDERQSELFYDAVGMLCEIMDKNEAYDLLCKEYDIPLEVIREKHLLSDSVLMGEGVAIPELNENDIRLWHVLRNTNFELGMRIVQDGVENTGSIETAVHAINEGNGYYEDILYAHVCCSRVGEKGNTEIVIDGVSQNLFEQFCAECDAIEEMNQGISQEM